MCVKICLRNLRGMENLRGMKNQAEFGVKGPVM
jgi:hypothetical protein